MKKILSYIQELLISNEKSHSRPLKSDLLEAVFFSKSVIDIFYNSANYYTEESLIYFPHIKAYGAFKYNVVKDILINNKEIGVSVVHLALNNIYFSEDEKKHQHNKQLAVSHLGFLSSKLQYTDSEYTRYLFNRFQENFPKNQIFDLVDYLINPLVLINILNEYGFLETFPEFDPKDKNFSFDNALQKIKTFFEDTDKLEYILKEHLDNNGTIPVKMQILLDEMNTGSEINRNDLPRYFRSMIFSAVESTTSFLSSFIYTVFNIYPELLGAENHQKDLYWIANEVLRIYTPVPFIYRTVRQDTVYANVHLKKGDMVVLFLGAANMDAAIFEEPHLMKNNRGEKHLSFGSGGYACIGRFASFRITMNVFSYLAEHSGNIEFADKKAKHYIHNSMLKLPLNISYNG